jgi:hypothetical protein
VRARLEPVLLGLSLLLVAAFVASLVLGLLAPPAGGDAGNSDDVAFRGPDGRVRVEVLNGSGRAGLARRATGQLRERGFDVVFFGNAGRPAEASYVLARTADPAPARAAAAALGIGEVRTEPDSTLFLEASVVLGPDWPPRARERAVEDWRARLPGWLGGGR